MALRQYKNAHGQVWTVWAVSPTFVSRNRKDRRALKTLDPAIERRATERRGLDPATDWTNGWLCFEGEHEKWRLSPVPLHWEKCSDEELEQARQHAILTTASV